MNFDGKMSKFRKATRCTKVRLADTRKIRNFDDDDDDTRMMIKNGKTRPSQRNSTYFKVLIFAINRPNMMDSVLAGGMKMNELLLAKTLYAMCSR
ncbi:unnamed protein product, partial [Mesorhabditis spiculigera]